MIGSSLLLKGVRNSHVLPEQYGARPGPLAVISRCGVTSSESANGRWLIDEVHSFQYERLDRCIALAKASRVVLMCAEAVPWRCHRSLVAEALIVRGIAVSEITSGVRATPHSLTLWAEVNGIQITYPDSAAERESRRPQLAPTGAEQRAVPQSVPAAARRSVLEPTRSASSVASNRRNRSS